MQTIQSAISKKLETLKMQYPKVGFIYGKNKSNFEHFITLDFSQAANLLEDNNFIHDIAKINAELIANFPEHWIIFLCEKTDFIKTIIESYEPLPAIVSQETTDYDYFNNKGLNQYNADDFGALSNNLQINSSKIPCAA